MPKWTIAWSHVISQRSTKNCLNVNDIYFTFNHFNPYPANVENMVSS